MGAGVSGLVHGTRPAHTPWKERGDRSRAVKAPDRAGPQLASTQCAPLSVVFARCRPRLHKSSMVRWDRPRWVRRRPFAPPKRAASTLRPGRRFGKCHYAHRRIALANPTLRPKDIDAPPTAPRSLGMSSDCRRRCCERPDRWRAHIYRRGVGGRSSGKRDSPKGHCPVVKDWRATSRATVGADQQNIADLISAVVEIGQASGDEIQPRG